MPTPPTPPTPLSTTPQNHLFPHEWMAIVFLIALLLILTLASHSCDPEYTHDFKTTPHHIVRNEIEVSILGEVENPGKYLIKRGSTIKELLAKAIPTQNADLRRIKITATLKKGQCIKIPALDTIKIILEFPAGLPHELIIPKGTKLSNLKDFYTFDTSFNVECLKKKRVLKDGEVIKISLN